MRDADKAACVDRWLSDVSDASRRWKTARAAQSSSERVVAYLEEIKSHMRGASPDLDERMEEAIARNRRNAEMLAEAAEMQAELESGFYGVIAEIRPAEVAEAWRMRCMEQKTWLQCSMALHYNRQHLERLSRSAKIEAYRHIPAEYRRAEGARSGR